MDELDLLLEELAGNSAGSAKTLPLDPADDKLNLKLSIPVSVAASGPRDEKNVYSQLPARGEDELMSPGTATRELDSIMNELLGLNLEEPAPVPPKPPRAVDVDTGATPQKKELAEGTQKRGTDSQSETLQQNITKNTDAIDDLLGTLNTDMQKMGVQTAAKGHCATCGKSISGKIITALGQTWHPEHFVCVECKEELGSKSFFERDGKPYCQDDYQKLFSPRCAYCQGPIVQNILTAMDRTWHPEHFFCTHCGEVFGPDGFMERQGKPYCPKDFYRLFAPKCSGCGEAVRENYLSAANGTWHPDCFVCADCLKPFQGGCFMELDGLPLCTQHYHSRMGTLCATCSEPIVGRCIAAMQRRFHPEHFLCAFCLRQLSQGVFKEQGGKPYCDTCHTKLFL